MPGTHHKDLALFTNHKSFSLAGTYVSPSTFSSCSDTLWQSYPLAPIPGLPHSHLTVQEFGTQRKSKGKFRILLTPQMELGNSSNVIGVAVKMAQWNSVWKVSSTVPGAHLGLRQGQLFSRGRLCNTGPTDFHIGWGKDIEASGFTYS